MGIGGQKPARDFTVAELCAGKFKYFCCKVDINRIYAQACLSQVTNIINQTEENICDETLDTTPTVQYQLNGALLFNAMQAYML
jgi:hypothetical protein